MAKFIKIDETTGKYAQEATTSTGGTGQENKVPNLGTSGRLAESMMPLGIGTDTVVAPASEGLSAGDMINLFNDSGTVKMRKADAGTNQYQAHGFVKEAVVSGNDGTAYLGGIVSGTFDAGDIGNPVFAGDTPGQATVTPVSGSGKLHQVIGTVISTTEFDFECDQPVVLA